MLYWAKIVARIFLVKTLDELIFVSRECLGEAKNMRGCSLKSTVWQKPNPEMEFWPFLDLQPAEHERGTEHWLWLSSHIHRNKNLEISFLFFLKVPGNKDLFTSASTSAFPATFVFLCASTTCQSDIPLTVYQHTPGKQTNAFTSMRATGEATQMPYIMPVWQRKAEPSCHVIC